MDASDDGRERSAALRFHYFVPEAPGFERVTDLAESETALSDELTQTLARRLRSVPGDLRAIDVAKRAVMRRGSREALLVALVECDVAWVLEHGIEIARVDGDRWKELLEAMYLAGHDLLGAMAKRLVDAAVVSRTDVLRHAREHYRGYGLGEVENAFAD